MLTVAQADARELEWTPERYAQAVLRMVQRAITADRLSLAVQGLS